jgi:DNA-binding ferritin-like protein
MILDIMEANETREREIAAEMDKISERIKTCKKGGNAESCQILMSKRNKLAKELCDIKDARKMGKECKDVK